MIFARLLPETGGLYLDVGPDRILGVAEVTLSVDEAGVATAMVRRKDGTTLLLKGSDQLAMATAFDDAPNQRLNAAVDAFFIPDAGSRLDQEVFQ
jgi:hypothetical protein